MAKKKEVVEPMAKSSLDLARQSIIKQYGEGVITFLGDHRDNKIDSVSTGCLALDAALGIGGFARGRIYEVYGPNSSGKSTLALGVCLNALKDGLTVGYVDAEHSLDPTLVKNMGNLIGVDPSTMLLVQAYTGDANLECAEKLIKTGEMDIVVIDSVSALLPRQMAEGEIGGDYMGLLARLMSKACLKLTPIANYANTMVIFINQIRHNIGKWGDDRVPTGGEALSFYATGRIKVEGGESKSSHIMDKNTGVVLGHTCDFTIVKNKLAAPWRTAKIGLIYGMGYDFIDEVVSLAVDFGMIEQAGSWFNYNGDKHQGKDSIIELFKSDFDKYEELRIKVKQALGLKDAEQKSN